MIFMPMVFPSHDNNDSGPKASLFRGVDLFHEQKDDKIVKGLEKYFKELEKRENKSRTYINSLNQKNLKTFT